jgi:Holliday junction resolvase
MMGGGRASRQKGNRGERIVVRLLQEFGFAAERVPLSGAARGRFGGDVSVPLLGINRRVEVKCRADGFREIYDGSTVSTFWSCALIAASHWWSCR